MAFKSKLTDITEVALNQLFPFSFLFFWCSTVFLGFRQKYLDIAECSMLSDQELWNQGISSILWERSREVVRKRREAIH